MIRNIGLLLFWAHLASTSFAQTHIIVSRSDSHKRVANAKVDIAAVGTESFDVHSGFTDSNGVFNAEQEETLESRCKRLASQHNQPVTCSKLVVIARQGAWQGYQKITLGRDGWLPNPVEILLYDFSGVTSIPQQQIPVAAIEPKWYYKYTPYTVYKPVYTTCTDACGNPLRIQRLVPETKLKCELVPASAVPPEVRQKWSSLPRPPLPCEAVNSVMGPQSGPSPYSPPTVGPCSPPCEPPGCGDVWP
jgi:hypothetical protein